MLFHIFLIVVQALCSLRQVFRHSTFSFLHTILEILRVKRNSRRRFDILPKQGKQFTPPIGNRSHNHRVVDNRLLCHYTTTASSNSSSNSNQIVFIVLQWVRTPIGDLSIFISLLCYLISREIHIQTYSSIHWNRTLSQQVQNTKLAEL